MYLYTTKVCVLKENTIDQLCILYLNWALKIQKLIILRVHNNYLDYKYDCHTYLPHPFSDIVCYNRDTY